MFTGYHSRHQSVVRCQIQQPDDDGQKIAYYFLKKKKKKKRKNDRVLCFAFELFCSVNNFKILTKKQNKTKQKRKKRKQKEKLLEVVAGFDPRTSGVWIPHLTAELPKPTVIYFDIKYQFISNMASRTIRPLTYAIPQFPF